MIRFDVLYTHETPAFYGGSILCETTEHDLPEKVVKLLNQFSIWGGNTSNSPEEYSFWEIENNHYIDAIICVLERAWGYEIVTRKDSK
jgi:hypothetical protein